MDYSLAGRIGKNSDGKPLVLLWNTDPAQLKQWLKPLLQELIKRNLITTDSTVGTPISNLTPVSAYLGGDFKQEKELTPQEKTALYQKLHTMPPDQKKKAMELLGVGSPPGGSPWNKEMRKQGYSYTDYWRNTSEGFKEWLVKNP